MSSFHLRVTDLAQYLGLRNCDRFLWFRLHPAQRQELAETLSVVESPIAPLLSQRGYWVEAEVAAKTRQQFPNFIDSQQQEIDPYLIQCQRDTVLSQVKLGSLGPNQLCRSSRFNALATSPAKSVADHGS